MTIQPGVAFQEIVDELDLAQPIYLTAFSLYFHLELENPRFIAPVDIRDTIDEVVGPGIDTGSQLQELRDMGLVERDSDKYRLTEAGLEYCLGRMEISTRDSADFLDVDVNSDVFEESIPDHERYIEILSQLNRSYRVGVFSGTTLLARCLFEQLTYQLLHDVHTPEGDTEMFFNVDRNCHYRFGELLKKLKDSYSEISRHHAELSSKGVFIAHAERVKDIKELGDTSAHSIRADLSRSDLEPLADPLSETFEIFYTVLLELNR